MKLTIAGIVVGCLSIVALAQQKTIFDTGADPATRPVAGAQTRPATQQSAAEVRSYVARQLEQLEEEVKNKKIAILQDAVARLDIIANAAMDKHNLERAQAAADYQRTLKARIKELSAGVGAAGPITIPADAAVFEGHHYKAFRGKATWQEASRRCEAVGGHLAYVMNARQDAFIAALLSPADAPSCVWLGAFYSEQWQWGNGAALGYSNWAPSGDGVVREPKPTPPDMYDRVVFIEVRFAGKTNPAANKWAALPADHKDVNGYICEWDK